MNQFVHLLAQTNDIEGDINSFSIRTVMVATLVLVVLLGFSAIAVKNKKILVV